jgi:hypothetical protein
LRLLLANGESGWTAHIDPAQGGRADLREFDGVGRGAQDIGSDAGAGLLGLGIAGTLAANVAHGLGHGPVGAAVVA